MMDRNISFPLTTGRRTLGFRDERSIREAVFGSKDFVQRMKLDTTLDVHRGCVNTIAWNERGSLILSGSDDKKLCFTDPYSRELQASIPSGHRSNIFSAKFLPCSGDKQVVSCSGDGCIMFSDLENPEKFGRNCFNCHYGTAYEVVTLPSDPNTFMSCGEDGIVRWFDLRIKTSCNKEECREDVMINCRRAVTGICVNPVLPYQLAVGCSDSSVRIFDRRMLGTKLSGNLVGRGMQGILCRFCPSHLQNKYSRPTSLTYSANGQDLLVSYSSDYIYLFGTNARYKEHVEEDAEAACGMQNDGLDHVLEEDGEEKDEFAADNPVKRLRLRGDWSDTGPRARPRSEQPEGERPRSTMVQRMSEMLSRWLEESSSSSPRRPVRSGSPGVIGSSIAASTSASTSVRSGSPGVIGSSIAASTSASTSTATTSATSTATTSATSQATSSNSATSPATPSTSSAQPTTTEATSPQAQQESSHQELEESPEASTIGGSSIQRDAITKTDLPVEKKPERSSEEVATVSRVETKDSRQTACAIGGAIKKGSRTETDRLRDEGWIDSRREGSRGGDTPSAQDNDRQGGVRKDLNSQERSSDPDRGPTVDSSPRWHHKDDPEQRFETDSGKAEKAQKATEKQSKKNGSQEKEEKEKKGIFALGERMEDKNPKPRLTNQDSLEHSRSRKHSIVDNPPIVVASTDLGTDIDPIQSEPSSSKSCRKKDQGKEGGGADEVERGDREGERREEEEKKEEKKSRSSTSSMQSVESETSQSVSSSRSMTCSESESDEDLLVLGAEREKKTPHQRDAPEPPRERVRSEAEMRLRELFKTRKAEREKEAEIIKNVHSPSVEMVYKGHRNSRTMIKEANFWGDHYIVSGSDCGHVFIWDRYTSKLVMLLEGDKHVVNCIQPHPTDPILATSGIDYNVKLWAPLAPEPYFPENSAEVMRINELMLEETRDTITVPPSFMLRMLASLNHLRGDRRRSTDPQSASESSDD